MQSGQKQTIKKNSSYYLTITVVDWIYIFTRKNHKKAIIDSLQYCIKNPRSRAIVSRGNSNSISILVQPNEPKL